MFDFILFKIAQNLVLLLPLKAGYWLAEKLADIRYLVFKKDRRAVKNNLKVVLKNNEQKAAEYARCVFRNFGKYLVDFLRFSKMGQDYISKFIELKNIEYLEEGLSRGKGVIVVTAHLGNWELGGAVTAMLGYPLSVIAWAHDNRWVNSLFIRQRAIKGVKVIPVGIGVKRTFQCLANNEMVALVGDIDFSHPDQGIEMDFFGRKAIIPKGPAAFSLKTGAPLVPAFMLRKKDDTFIFAVEKPIIYDTCGNLEEDLRNLTGIFLRTFEDYISRYPSQWFMAREIWK